MMIGDRQRYRDLAIVLLTELAAVLARHPDRMSPLLGKARVIDDPGLDRPAALDRRHDQFAHLGQNRRVRPRCVADKMQQLLVLSRHSRRRRHRRYRFHALALTWHHKPQAIVPQRCCPVRVTNDAHKSLDIGRKPRLTVPCPTEIHPSLLMPVRESPSLQESLKGSPATF